MCLFGDTPNLGGQVQSVNTNISNSGTGTILARVFEDEPVKFGGVGRAARHALVALHRGREKYLFFR